VESSVCNEVHAPHHARPPDDERVPRGALPEKHICSSEREQWFALLKMASLTKNSPCRSDSDSPCPDEIRHHPRLAVLSLS
jgi:hypothetical protein